MIQPLGPMQIWQKISAFSASNSTNHISPEVSLPNFETSLKDSLPFTQYGLTGSIGKENSSDIVPLSPFGSHTQIMGLNNDSPLVPSTLQAPDKYRNLIIDAAQKAGIDINLFDALVSTESNYQPHLVSKAGAIGLAQLMPQTALSLGVTDPFDPKQNLNGGARYLSLMLKRFGGNIEHALAAYNAGPNAIKRYGGVPPYEETRNYVKKIFQKYQR